MITKDEETILNKLEARVREYTGGALIHDQNFALYFINTYRQYGHKWEQELKDRIIKKIEKFIQKLNVKPV